MKNRLPLALVSLAALSVAAPVFAQTAEQKATMERARKLYQETKYFDAINLLTSIYGAFEKSVDYQNLLALSFYNNALTERPGTSLHELHLARALEAGQSSLALKPRQIEIQNLLGKCFFEQGNFAEAEKEFRVASAQEPTSGSLHANIGRACLEQKKWPEAEMAFAQAVKLEPRSASYQSNLGIVRFEQKKWAEAQVAFAVAVTLEPGDAYCHNFLGLSLFRQDKWSAAEPEFRKALALDSKQISHTLNVGAALLKQGKKADALPFVQEARRLGLQEHWAITELGLASTPIPTAPLSKVLIAQDAKSLEFLVRHALEDKSYAEAEALSTKLIAQVPGNPVFFADRGIARGELKKFTEAYADAVRAETLFRLQDGRPNQLAWAISNRAAAALQLGEPYRALAEALAATDIDPAFAPGWLIQADAWYTIGELQRAVVALTNAKSLDSTIVRNYTPEGATKNALGKTPFLGNASSHPDYDAAIKASNEKRFSDAEKSFTRLQEQAPKFAGGWSGRGYMVEKQLNYPGARLDYSTGITLFHTYQPTALNTIKSSYMLRANIYQRLGDLLAAIDDCKMVLKLIPGDPEATPLLAMLQKSAEPVGAAVLIALEAAVDKAALAYEKNLDRKPAAPLKKQLDALLNREPSNAKLLVLRGRLEQIQEEITFDDARAMVFFERAVAADPNNADAYYYRGLSRVNVAFIEVPEAKKRETLEDLKKSVTLGRSDTETLSQLARAFAEVREWSEATKYSTQAIEKSPKEANFYRFRAGYYENQNLWTKALTDWSQVITLKPDASSHAGRAMAYVGNKQFAEAFTDFERALALDPKDETIFVERARAKRLKGDKAGALADYAKARELDDTIPAVKPDLSDAEQAELASRDTEKRAASRAARPIDLDMGKVLEAKARLPKIQARLKRAKEGDTRTDAQILEEFDKSEKEKTLDEVDYRERATVFAKQQKFDEALADCDKAIALKSGYAAAYNLRGLIYRQKKDDEKALLDFNKAIELEPRSAMYLRNRGTLFTSQRNFVRALSDLNQAILNDPKSAPSYLQRGNVYAQQKNYDAAIADYDKALELDPKLTAAEKNRELAKKRKTGG